MHVLHLEWSERLAPNPPLLTTNAAGATHWLTASAIRWRQLSVRHGGRKTLKEMI